MRVANNFIDKIEILKILPSNRPPSSQKKSEQCNEPIFAGYSDYLQAYVIIQLLET